MSIFHSPAFCNLHRMDLANGIIPWGYVSNLDEWRSPTVGTFGGFSGGTIEDMEKAIFEFPLGRKIISLAPQSHDENLFMRSVSVLDKHGFKVKHGDINYSIEVDDKPLSVRMVGGHRKKLAKCERAGFDAKELNKSEWLSAYALLDANRRRKDRKLSMSYQQMMEQDEAIPHLMKVFGVFDGTKLLSAAICVRVKPDVQYVYAWGDSGDSEFAPTIMLASHIYDHCLTNKIRIMDIGISTENGVPNLGLMKFKENLGFKQSIKLTMVKDA